MQKFSNLQQCRRVYGCVDFWCGVYGYINESVCIIYLYIYHHNTMYTPPDWCQEMCESLPVPWLARGGYPCHSLHYPGVHTRGAEDVLQFTYSGSHHRPLQVSECVCVCVWVDGCERVHIYSVTKICFVFCKLLIKLSIKFIS